MARASNPYKDIRKSKQAKLRNSWFRQFAGVYFICRCCPEVIFHCDDMQDICSVSLQRHRQKFCHWRYCIRRGLSVRPLETDHVKTTSSPGARKPVTESYRLWKYPWPRHAYSFCSDLNRDCTVCHTLCAVLCAAGGCSKKSSAFISTMCRSTLLKSKEVLKQIDLHYQWRLWISKGCPIS